MRSRFESCSSATAKASAADVSLMFHDSLQYANDTVTEVGQAEASIGGKVDSGVPAMTAANAIFVHPALANANAAWQKNPLFLGTCVRQLQSQIQWRPRRASVNLARALQIFCAGLMRVTAEDDAIRAVASAPTTAM